MHNERISLLVIGQLVIDVFKIDSAVFGSILVLPGDDFAVDEYM